MSFTSSRLSRELAKIKSEKIEGIEILTTDDLSSWTALVDGPPGTPFEKGKFRLEIKFNENYPLKPPSVKFIDKIFHPNVYNDGKICVDILQGAWRPVQNVSTILISIRSLLIDPNPDSPANREAASLFVKNREEYNNRIINYINNIKV